MVINFKLNYIWSFQVEETELSMCVLDVTRLKLVRRMNDRFLSWINMTLQRLINK